MNGFPSSFSQREEMVEMFIFSKLFVLSFKFGISLVESYNDFFDILETHDQTFWNVKPYKTEFVSLTKLRISKVKFKIHGRVKMCSFKLNDYFVIVIAILICTKRINHFNLIDELNPSFIDSLINAETKP
jgi:hypothetical protein